MISAISKWFAKKQAPIDKPNPVIVKATFVEKPNSTGNGVMTITLDDGTIQEFYGSSTVWRHVPTFERLPTTEEYKLCSIWHYIQYYGNDWPTAHEKTETNV
jgi:hypothetical protein